MHYPAKRWLHLGSFLALALVIPSGCYVVPAGGVVRTETVVTEAPPPPPPLPASTTVVETAPVYDAPPVVEAPIVENEVIYVDEYHHHAPRTYVYYPGEEVYYDPISISFFWCEGGHWRSGRRLPSHIHLHEEHRVSFRSDAAHPYDVHTRISSRYHGSYASSRRDGDRRYESPRSGAQPRTFSPSMTPGAPARTTAPDRVLSPGLRTPSRVTSPTPAISPSVRTPSRIAPASPAISPSVRSQVAPARVSTPTMRDPITPSRVVTPSLRGTAPPSAAERTVSPSLRSQVAPARVSTPAVRAQVAPGRASVAPSRSSESAERKRVEGRVIAQ